MKSLFKTTLLIRQRRWLRVAMRAKSLTLMRRNRQLPLIAKAAIKNDDKKLTYALSACFGRYMENSLKAGKVEHQPG